MRAHGPASFTPDGQWIPVDVELYLKKAQEWNVKYANMCFGSGGDSVYGRSFACPASQLEWSFVEPDLPPMDPKAFLTRYKDKTLAFVGDSMVRQVFDRFLCSLGGYEVDVSGAGPIRGPPPGNFRKAVMWNNVTLLNQWTSKFIYGVKDDIFNADVKVFHIGAFIKKPAGMQSWLNMWAEQLIKPGTRVLAQEYSAPHFPTDTGDFEGLAIPDAHDTKVCRPLDAEKFKTGGQGLRLTMADDFWEARGVTVMRLFNLSMQAVGQHCMAGGTDGTALDCRHFCDPSPYSDARNDLLYKHLMDL